MEFEVTRDIRNELLSRREVDFTLRFDGPTPSRVQVIGKLAAQLNVGGDQMVLDSMKARYGMAELRGNARIYDSKEAKEKTERPYLVSRGMPKQKEEA